MIYSVESSRLLKIFNIVFHFFSKSPLGLAMSLVGIAAVFLALIISAKDILAKKAA